jgi:hypothetical protein
VSWTRTAIRFERTTIGGYVMETKLSAALSLSLAALALFLLLGHAS